MRDINAKARDGIDLAVRDHGGDGPDVLLLHGATRNLEDWGSVLRELDGVRAVTMDQRCHGYSGVSSTFDWVGDIECVIEGLGLSNPYVVGHSMGGVNAVLYGLDHPECPGVLDVDGYDVRQPEFYDELPTESVREFLEIFNARSQSLVPLEDEGDDEWHERQVAVFKQMDATWGVDETVTRGVVSRAFVMSTNGRWQRRPPSAFWGFGIWDGGSADVLDMLRRVSCPVTFVFCARQIPAPMPPGAAEFFEAGKRGVERHLKAIAAGRPNVRVELIDATHGIIYEQPQTIAALIKSLAE